MVLVVYAIKSVYLCIPLAFEKLRLDLVFESVFIYEPRREKKTAFCICENKDADQLRGNREADQRLFCYTDSTIPLLPKYEISSL